MPFPFWFYSRSTNQGSYSDYLTREVNKIFQDDDPDNALEDAIDGNLQRSYPMEDIYKMTELSQWCLRKDPADRPEDRCGIVTIHPFRSLLSKLPTWSLILPNAMHSWIPGGVTAAEGFKASDIYGGLCAKGEKPDLALVTCYADFDRNQLLGLA